MIRFVVDDSWHRPRDRHVVMGGSPVRMFRLTDAGVTVADALEREEVLPKGHEALTSRLTSAGAIHPFITEAVDASAITVVVPTYATSPAHLERLERLIGSFADHRVVVVDDASSLAIPSGLAGATVVRRTTNGGPGAARNTGLSLVGTEFVAFVDDDVDTTSAVLCLAAAQCTNGVAMCAPRVSATTPAKSSAISRYESTRSPLDMGDKPGRVAPLSRVAYVPAAVLVARTSECTSIGGFDEGLRVGEDVDFVWRLSKVRQCRYESTIVAHHATRPTLRGLLAQRRKYGSSAAALASRHGSLVSPYASNLLLFALTASASVGAFVVAALCAVMHVGYVSTSLRRAGDDATHALTMAAMSIAHATRVFADAIVRTWLPIYAVFALIFPTVWWIIVAAAVVPAIAEWWKVKHMNVVTYALLRTADCVAYCVGVWSGVWRAKSMRCLVPRITLSRRREA